MKIPIGSLTFHLSFAAAMILTACGGGPGKDASLATQESGPTERISAASAIAPVLGRDIYISPTGVDSSTTIGDVGHPFKSPGYVAKNVVAAGDTVYLMTGQYSRFIATVDGTSDSNRVTWKAYPGQTPEIVIGPEAWYGIAIQANYQTIDGLTVTGYNDSVTLAQAETDYNKYIQTWFVRNPATGKNDINPATGLPVTVDTPNPTYVAGYGGSGSFSSSGIDTGGSPDNKGHHLTVINSIVRKCGCTGLGTGDKDYTVFKNNRVYDNAWYSPYGCSGMGTMVKNENPNDTFTGYRNVITDNIIWNNRGLVKWLGKGTYKDSKNQTRQADGAYSDGNGFIFDVAKLDSAGGVYKGRSLFTNNLMAHNGGSGVHVFNARNVDIINNTAYMNGDKVDYPDIYAAYSTDVKMFNNVVYARPGGKVNSANRNVNVFYDYNVYFNGTIAAGTLGAHDIVADPLLVNPRLEPCTPNASAPTVSCTADFSLQASSLAIDSGVTIAGTTPTQDFFGVTRPQGGGVDRGAYEAGAQQANAGWQATYFNNANLTGTRVVRTDSAIDFNWQSAAPVTGIEADTFSVRWRGNVTAPATGTYTLTTTTDDGVRLWVDGVLVIDKWIGQSATEHSGTVNLTAGKAVPMIMEFYQNLGDASARLEWASSTVGRQVIPATAVTAPSDASLPGPYAAVAIGAGSSGTASESEGTWTLDSMGGDIWNKADVVEFASRPLTGDGTVIACVNAQTRSDPWAKAGIMWRESKGADARYASLFTTPDNGVVFQRRLVTGEATAYTASANAALAAPYCLRLVRSGNTFIASMSADRANWGEVGRDVIPMGSTVQVGLAASSHSAKAATHVTFSQFTVQSATAGQ